MEPSSTSILIPGGRDWKIMHKASHGDYGTEATSTPLNVEYSEPIYFVSDKSNKHSFASLIPWKKDLGSPGSSHSRRC